MIIYKCNCKKHGLHKTKVNKEGVCIYCGYYAIAVDLNKKRKKNKKIKRNKSDDLYKEEYHSFISIGDYYLNEDL